MSKINVAITGTLSQPRKLVAEMINATSNGHFVEEVTLSTHYLVCAKTDSQKAKKAARLGTSVISERELTTYLGEGHFPPTELPERPVHHNNFPEIEWSLKDDPEVWLMTYCDAHGDTSIRKVLVTCTGFTAERPDIRWVGGFDGPQFKSWRQDRIKEAEVLGLA